jgi:phosphatidylinositol glycan class M
MLLSPELQDALWWLYNPLAVNICTRGSAESLMVLLPVLATVWIASAEEKTWPSALIAGLWHGVAIHAKLYPVIYTLSFMAAFAATKQPRIPRSTKQNQKWTPRRIATLLFLWIQRLLTPAPLVFAVTSVATFGALTYAAVRWYGPAALHEGLLYHFSRVDHRHNYSMHWYWIYLARAAQQHGDISAANMALAGRLLLLPQLILLVYTSLGVAPNNLSLALFIQTFLFVAHNKVITAQYFTWYLCLLPLCSDSFSWTPRVRNALVALGGAVAFWLFSAYCLEMQGMAVHGVVWFASVVFFAANVNLLGALVNSSQREHLFRAKEE